ncbi:Hypothetical protein UVM_LOCUS351 [uncultured virus]|nr:Hypothetical protein UVM_LOCUS351 [uncultured virus]
MQANAEDAEIERAVLAWFPGASGGASALELTRSVAGCRVHKTDMNRVLYALEKRGVLHRDGKTPPRWTLATTAAADPRSIHPRQERGAGATGSPSLASRSAALVVFLDLDNNVALREIEADARYARGDIELHAFCSPVYAGPEPQRGVAGGTLHRSASVARDAADYELCFLAARMLERGELRGRQVRSLCAPASMFGGSRASVFGASNQLRAGLGPLAGHQRLERRNPVAGSRRRVSLFGLLASCGCRRRHATRGGTRGPVGQVGCLFFTWP